MPLNSQNEDGLVGSAAIGRLTTSSRWARVAAELPRIACPRALVAIAYGGTALGSNSRITVPGTASKRADRQEHNDRSGAQQAQVEKAEGECTSAPDQGSFSRCLALSPR